MLFIEQGKWHHRDKADICFKMFVGILFWVYIIKTTHVAGCYPQRDKLELNVLHILDKSGKNAILVTLLYTMS